MRPMLILTLLVALLAAPAVAASTEGRWLHVRVEGPTPDENVSLNLPLSMVDGLLTMAENEEIRDGKIGLDDRDVDGAELRRMLELLRDAPDSEFVTIRSRDESVRVAKETGYLLVLAEDETGGESVRVRVPIAVVEAMLGGAEDELDLRAGLEALGEETGELVVVEADGETIRIWIDIDEDGR